MATPCATNSDKQALVHQASAKRVHDAKEIYDGVPSLHDAKAAWLYQEGLTNRGMSTGKIESVIHSAATTLEQPCIAAERRYLQALAEELRRRRKQAKNAGQALEAAVKARPELKEMGLTIGKVTTAILIGLHLEPRHFAIHGPN